MKPRKRQASGKVVVDDIEIVWERASTGVLTDRLLASQGPRPDAAWGLAVTSMLLLDRIDLLA